MARLPASAGTALGMDTTGSFDPPALGGSFRARRTWRRGPCLTDRSASRTTRRPDDDDGASDPRPPTAPVPARAGGRGDLPAHAPGRGGTDGARGRRGDPDRW